jgi:cobalamin synthase
MIDDQDARRRAAEPAGDGPPAGPRFHDFVAAVGVLTCLPLSRPDPQSAAYGRATTFFPGVGLCLGVALAGLHRLLAPTLGRWVAAPLLVALWEGLAGGQAYRGAVLASVVFGVAKALVLAIPASVRPAALLFAPMLGHWGLVVLLVGARDAAAPAHKFNTAIGFREFALASVFSFIALFAVAEAFGIFIAACGAALTLAIRLLAHRRMGGVSWPLLQVTRQLIETMVLVLFALP